MESRNEVDAPYIGQSDRRRICKRSGDMAVFGAESGLAIVLFTVMFIFSSYIVMKISFKVQSTHFLPVLEHLMGPWLAKIYDILIVFYLFSTTMVMIAGGGVTLQMYKLPFWWGIAPLCIVTVCLFFGM